LGDVRAVLQLQNAAKETVKVGLNRYLDISLLVKRPFAWKNWFENFATVSAGVQVTGVIEQKPTFKTGFEVAINL
jgi:hypothetical protein